METCRDTDNSNLGKSTFNPIAQMVLPCTLTNLGIDIQMIDATTDPGSYKRAYSQHPESVKRRKREERMDDTQKKVEKAKAADRAARHYSREKVKASDAYKLANAEERIKMMLDVDEVTMRKR